MTVDMGLGDTQLIVATCAEQGLLRNQAAYVCATAYWETARTMLPVEEAYYLESRVRDLDAWRKKNLRYYPWHGRGYTQTTWERNYRKVMAETGVDVISDPSKAMLPEVAVVALVVGARDGWWTGKKLSDYITLKKSNYVGARRVINGPDKARAIAEIARVYEAALLAQGYGVETTAPVVNDNRDGTAPRGNPAQSTTIQAVIAAALATAGQTLDAVKGVVAQVSEALGISPEAALAVVTGLALAWVFRERIRKVAAGDR